MSYYCPNDDTRLRLERWDAYVRDYTYYCSLCGESWPERRLMEHEQDIHQQMRAALRRKLAANKAEESGT